MGLTNQIGLALIAGTVAITINILLLNLADALGIVTARGGLQRLVKLWLSNPFVRWGVADLWAALGLPRPDTALFKTGFKVAVGLLMAVGYAVVLEPHLPGNWVSKALVYAVLIWLVNAFVVLPWLDEGIAGVRYLRPGGMAFFAFAHTAFFLTLAFVYEALTTAAV